MKQRTCLPEFNYAKKSQIRKNQDYLCLLYHSVQESFARETKILICLLCFFVLPPMFPLQEARAAVPDVIIDNRSLNDLAINRLNINAEDSQENLPPLASCKNITVMLGSAGTVTIFGSDVDGGSSDPDGTIISRNVTPDSFDCSDLGTNSVTLTVTDNGGLTSSCTATVSVIDRRAPTIVCRDFTLFLDRSGSGILNSSDINNGSTDNCPDGLRLYLSRTTFSCSDIGSSVPVSLVGTDGSGNSASCTAQITVVDTVSPKINLKSFNLVLDASGTGTLVPGDIDNGTYDNCGPAILSVTPNTFNCTHVGKQTVTMTAVDSYGNTSAGKVDITISSPVKITGMALSTCDLTPTSALWSAEVEGGAGGYSYFWKGLEETSKPFMVIIPIPPAFLFSNTSTALTPFFNNNMPNGVYNISLVVTDVRGCTDTSLVTINKSGPIFNNISYRNSESCQGATETYSVNHDPDANYSWSVLNGTILTADTDTSRIVVRWNTGVTEGSVTGTTLKPDFVGDPCQSYVIETVTLNATPSPAFNSPVTDVCANSEYTYTLTGTYSFYNWSVAGGNITDGGSVSDNYVTVRWGSGPAGNVSVSVLNSSSCDAIASETIAISGVTGTITSITNITCNGYSDGTVTVVASSGQAPYSYSVDGGGWQTGNTFTGLSLGNHTVSIRDNLFCTFEIPFVISQPTILSGTVSGQTNVSCFGGSDGTVTISAAGGTPAYQYSINGGAFQDSNILAGISAGSYTANIRDANGCIYSIPIIITQPAAPLSGSLTVTDVDCYGASTGEVDLTVTGGTAPYTFLWDNAAVTEDLANIGSGNYSVTITDSKGCTFVVSATVDQPDAELTSGAMVTDVSCFDEENGSIDISPSGGTAPYTYLWSNGATTQDITGLAPGTYSVTITDTQSCTFTTGGTITQPAAPLSGNALITSVNCFNGLDGAINLTVSGGTGPYLFSWNTGAITEDLSGLTAGTYTVTINDANSCMTTVTAIVSQPAAALSGSVMAENIKCNGASTGNINLSVTGGTSPYTYLWSNGTTTEDLNNVPAGTYSVVITDDNDCETTAGVTLTEPAEPLGAAISSQINVLCYGGNNGSFTVTGTGGVAPYEYQLGTGTFQLSEDFGSLTAGNYTVTVRDANLCRYSVNVIITQPVSALNLSPGPITDVLCFGDASGSLDVVASGGTAPYEYSIEGGVPQSSSFFEGLPAGTYDITVIDNNLCSFTLPVTINQPDAVLGGSIISQENVSCFGLSTASLTIAGDGGTAPYVYSLNSGAFQSSGIFNDLAAGSYNVIIRDANMCEFMLTVNITQPATFLTFLASKTDNLCFGGLDGSASVIPSGGTAPYTYSWNTVPEQIAASISGLAAGTYTITVTDDNGCIASEDIIITQPSVGISASAAVTGVSCYGLNSGAIDLTVNNGMLPLEYSWNNGASTQDLENLTAGNYTVVVTDANNCQVTISATVNQPSALTADIDIDNVACFGENSGSIDLSVTGGTMPYSFNWNNGSVTEDLVDLVPGTYSVTITDANSCAIIVNGIISQPLSALGGSLTGKSDVTVYAGSDGSATVTGEGGSVPYMYRIGTGNYQVSGSFDGLSAGSYIITVRDVNLCTFEVSFTISQPLIPLTANIISLVNPACPGTSTGLVTIEGWGGTAPYEYSVDGVLFNQSGTFGSLAAGTYTITVKDALMAVFDIVVTLSDPSVLNITFTSTEALCFGGSTGMATAIVSGGTLPYSYSWNSDPVQTVPTATGLKAASYTVTVTDGNNCTMTGNVTIGQPASELSVSIATVRVSCAGGANGTATATAAGGTAPYSYSWQTSPVQTTHTATGLSAGTYAVTVTDANGCTTTGTELVTEPPELYIGFTSTDASCPDAADGTLSLNISGGVGPFNVIWSDGNLLQSRTNLLPGTYNAVVTDANGCAGSVNAEVGFTGTYNCVEIPHVITPNNDGFNDEWVIRNISLYPDAEVRVFNRWGKLIFRTKNISANPWDGRYNGQLVPTDSYHYILYLNDGSEPKSGVISVIR